MASRRSAANGRPSSSSRSGRNGRSSASPKPRGANSRHATPPDNGAANLEHQPLPKTPFSDEALEEFRRLLLEKRSELVGTVSHMEDETLRKTRSDSAGDLSMMPIHMADIGTDNYEQEFSLNLIANEREMLKEIDEALERISDRTFGICLGTHQPINKERLLVKPWAKYSLEYKQQQESGRRR